ncbi:MAG: Flp pilus assembly protein CpaB [Alphaproteobacteria bacterium]|nr:Flp pilus assembly protein CpaB [Alphaproteobacteria bacterium]
MAREGGGGPLRALIFLALAIGAGSFSLVMLYKLITSYQMKIDEAKRPEDTVMVIVAARDLYQGVTITEEDLYAVQIPPKFLPEGVFLSPEHVVGRIPRERILANEFVRADRLADPESGVGLNAIIPRGMRAISINITDGAALSGFLNPGNYVDVLVTIKPDAGGGEDQKNRSKEQKVTETKTILQAVFVLGVNSRMKQESSEDAEKKRGKNKPSVTLLVTADQAEQIAHAENLGEIVLTLRNDLDYNYMELEGVDVSDLRSKLVVKKEVRPTRTVKAAPAAPKKQCREVSMIMGGEKRVILVDENGIPCD